MQGENIFLQPLAHHLTTPPPRGADRTTVGDALPGAALSGRYADHTEGKPS